MYKTNDTRPIKLMSQAVNDKKLHTNKAAKWLSSRLCDKTQLSSQICLTRHS